MTTVLGLPLFGSLFLPLIIAALTVFLYKLLYRSSTETEINGDNVNNFISPVKSRVKRDLKEKKSCSGKKGGKGCCSTKSGLINITRLFVDSSPCTKGLSESLLDLWKKKDMNVDVIPLNGVDLEDQLLKETGDVSLCVFLLDKNEEMPILKPWLENLVNASPTKGDILSGLKYSVFVANGTEGEAVHHETDRALHRLGGVRVCKAGTLDFNSWLDSLSLKVSKWNQSGKKGCKCGPDDTNDTEVPDAKNGEESSCSGNCSSSEDEATPSPVLDLEDLGKALS